MKTFYKKSLFILTLALVGVSLSSDNAYAGGGTYAVGCVSGNCVYASAYINDTYAPGATIGITGISMLSQVPSVEQVSLGAYANGSGATLVSSSISSGGTVYGNYVDIGPAPTTAGSYSVSFTGGYSVGAMPQIVVSASVTSGPSLWYPQDLPGSGRCTVILNSSNLASQSISGTVDIRNDIYPSSQPLATVNLTIPAWSTQSNMYVMEPASPMAMSGWCSKDWDYIPTITSLTPTTVDGKSVTYGNVQQE